MDAATELLIATAANLAALNQHYIETVSEKPFFMPFYVGMII